MPKTIEDPRTEILKQAKQIMLNEGYNALTIRAVAKECNFAVGTIYNYFRTKDELLAQLIGDYWEVYYGIMGEIDQEDLDLPTKLRKMYEQLEFFVNTFLETWVTMDRNNHHNYSKAGRQRKDDFTERLIIKLKSMLDRENHLNNATINSGMTTYEISKFIILNFLMMAQMKQLEYDSFAKILKVLFKES